MGIELAQVAGGKGVGQLGPCQAAQHSLAQIGLGHAGHCGVDGGERRGQVTAGRLAMRVQHGPTQKATAQFTTGADAVAHAQRLLLAGVEVKEAQGAEVRAVVELDQQLAARLVHHLAVHHFAFNLDLIAFAPIAQHRDVRFVFVAQRQVQGQVDVALEAELVHQLLHGVFGRRGLDCGLLRLNEGDGKRGLWHGTILPCLFTLVRVCSTLKHLCTTTLAPNRPPPRQHPCPPLHARSR